MTLSPRLQKMVDMGDSGLDIMHGELKNLMLVAEWELDSLSPLQDEPQYKYVTGLLDAYATVYQLTYELAFAIGERREARG